MALFGEAEFESPSESVRFRLVQAATIRTFAEGLFLKTPTGATIVRAICEEYWSVLLREQLAQAAGPSIRKDGFESRTECHCFAVVDHWQVSGLSIRLMRVRFPSTAPVFDASVAQWNRAHGYEL